MSENLQMNNAIDSIKIQSPSITPLSGGEVNETYLVDGNEGKYILQVMYPSPNPEVQLLTAYAHPNRGGKIAALLPYLDINGIPALKSGDFAPTS